MLTLTEVAKEYDLKPVLDDVNLTLSPGLRYVLTAPNGSGKTTLLQLMAGLSKPTRGKLTWNDTPFTPNVRRQIGAVFQEPMLYGDLSGEENLRFYGNLYGLRHVKERARKMLTAVNLQDAGTQRVRQYSKGMKQRLSLARALLHQPELLLLDEPFDGMDKASRDQAELLIANCVSAGSTLFLVTHDVAAHADADVFLTIRHGRLVSLS